jgi:site-specific DNA-cytosine methylase
MVSNDNWNDIQQLGDILKWKDWNINWAEIDLLLGGFPCQSWSVAAGQQGDKDPRGALLWVMLDIFNHIKSLNPEVKFLFENVKMKKEFIDYINNAIGVTPILIDSALVSAQRRKRLYWTNIPDITQPEDRNIKLVDIIENGMVDRDKSFCIDASYFKGGNLKSYFEKNRRQLVFNYSSSGRGNGKVEGRFTYADKSLTLTATGASNRSFTGVVEDFVYRKLTPIECERLQTISDEYSSIISNTQRYKCLGNAWTVDVIVHIFKSLKLHSK